MVFKDMFYAVKSPADYKSFLEKKGWKVFLYGVLLITVYFLLVNVFPVARFQVMHGGFRSIIEYMVPEFEIKDGKLSVPQKIRIDRQDAYVLVDVDTDYEWIEDDWAEVEQVMKESAYRTMLFADCRTIAVKSSGQVEKINVRDLKGMDISKESIYKFIPMANLIVVLIMAIGYIVDIALFFFGVLIISLLGMIAKAVMKADFPGLTFGRIFLLCVYARTTPIAIKAVLNMFHVGVPFFWMMSAAISLVYLSLALKSMKEAEEEKSYSEQL